MKGTATDRKRDHRPKTVTDRYRDKQTEYIRLTSSKSSAWKLLSCSSADSMLHQPRKDYEDEHMHTHTHKKNAVC